jgi:hypothetical protein
LGLVLTTDPSSRGLGGIHCWSFNVYGLLFLMSRKQSASFFQFDVKLRDGELKIHCLKGTRPLIDHLLGGSLNGRAVSYDSPHLVEIVNVCSVPASAPDPSLHDLLQSSKIQLHVSLFGWGPDDNV